MNESNSTKTNLTPHNIKFRIIVPPGPRELYLFMAGWSKPEYKDIGFLHFAILHEWKSSKVEHKDV